MSLDGVYVCKYAGQPIKDLRGRLTACIICKHVEVEGTHIKHVIDARLARMHQRLDPPRPPSCMIWCPATKGLDGIRKAVNEGILKKIR